jgi:hypothetical protein
MSSFDLKVLSQDRILYLKSKRTLTRILYPLLGVLTLTLSISFENGYAQCSEPELEEAHLMSTSALEMISPEDALSREAGDWSLGEHVVGGLSPQRYLRSLALDLLGRLPTGEEQRDLQEQQGVISETLLDTWFTSADFASQAVRLVKSQLWNNISNLNLYSANVSLARTNQIYWRRNPARFTRGDRVPCLNQPASYDSEGQIVTFEQEDGTEREGWVWVNPYWAPNTQVKACAFDAQMTEYSSNGTYCGTNGGMNRPDCGCGEDMKWCVTGQVRNEVTRSLAKSMDLLIESIFIEGDSYLQLFQERRFFINGPLVHFFKHHKQISRYTLTPSPVPEWQLPEFSFNETERWTQLILEGEHSGVLTHPAFLLRFQTNRARASRFYETFLCSPFQPPEGGLPVADEESVRNPDLQERAGCKYCHALLEPAASYWGRWTEQGIAYLNPERFPAEREDCLSCALSGGQCSNECRTHYITTTLLEQEVPYLGKLKAYSFRRDEHGLNVERGPRLLAYNEITGQRLPRCVAQRTAEWLLGKEMSDGVANERDRRWLDVLGIRFARSGYNYATLIKDIVIDERYRRVR